jgi:hypothetical protein
MNQIIESKFKEFVAKSVLFTSVDISNSIKKDGTWVRNSEVAHWLRSNAIQIATNYTTTQIEVCQGKHTATLYYPSGANPDDYKDRDQIAQPPIVPVPNTSVSNIPTKLATNKIKIRPDGKARLRIPASFVKELGWNPGDKVEKDRILANNEDISEDLIVHSDGRIAFSRKCVAWGDGPVIIFIDNNRLCFEKP